MEKGTEKNTTARSHIPGRNPQWENLYPQIVQLVGENNIETFLSQFATHLDQMQAGNIQSVCLQGKTGSISLLADQVATPSRY